MPRSKPRFTRQRPPDPESLAATWRLFLAVPAPPAAVDLVARIVGRLGEGDALPVRWVEPGQAHLTVRFIGEVAREQAELIRLALGPVIATHPVFRLRTADLGCFPTIRRPRVLWLGLHGPVHRLVDLQADVTRTLTELDVPPDTDAFHPHITLGRVRSDPETRVRDIPAAVRERFDALMADGLGTQREPAEIAVDELVLFRSILGPAGARHEIVQRYPLAPRKPGVTREPTGAGPPAPAPPGATHAPTGRGADPHPRTPSSDPPRDARDTGRTHRAVRPDRAPRRPTRPAPRDR